VPNPIIRKLDNHTINKIAAGEVIENPASVVKELIDNALDAGSTEITVDIKQGGRTLIRVADNGIGMEKEDALLSLERHATSKIQEVEDLFSIDTMGFRGEAIPSIASISKFSLHTRRELATYLDVEGGELLSVDMRDRSQGTTIEVRDLFFNVPVRRKFQKSPAYDAIEVHKTVMKLALANPSCHFELTSDNEVILKTRGIDLKSRIEDVLGKDYLDEALPIYAEGHDMIINGFLGKPLASKPNRLSQHLFINRRPVFSPFIAECIRESYGSAMPEGRFPMFVLEITAPKDLIDINVHPQKKEVRLRHFDQFKSVIAKAIQSTLFGKAPEIPRSTFVINSVPLERPQFVCREEEEIVEERCREQELPLPPPKRELYLLFVSSEIALLKGALGEGEALFTMIDLKALRETVLSASLKEESTRELVPFLIPYVFQVPYDEEELLKNHLVDLEKSGIPLREFGDGHFCLEALPSSFGSLNLGVFIEDLIAGLKEDKKVLLWSVAKASDNKIPSPEEVKSWIHTLEALEFPRFSPSGKPIYTSLDSQKAKKVIGLL